MRDIGLASYSIISLYGTSSSGVGKTRIMLDVLYEIGSAKLPVTKLPQVGKLQYTSRKSISYQIQHNDNCTEKIAKYRVGSEARF